MKIRNHLVQNIVIRKQKWKVSVWFESIGMVAL